MTSKPLSVNLRDQGVRDFLGVDRVQSAGQQGRELVQVAGDVPAPDGSGDLGFANTWHLNRSAIGHPFVIYKQSILVVDVYEVPGEPMNLVLICPKCHHALNISAAKKRMEFDRVIGAPNPTRKDEEMLAQMMTTWSTIPPRTSLQRFGSLSVEPFECTWEMSAHRAEFGTSLCRWKVAIDNNVAKDA